MTECHSVPSEGRKGPLEKVLNILSCPLRGSTLQCDARKTPQCDAGQSNAPEGVCLFTPVVCFIARLSPLSFNRPLRPSGTSPNLGEESGVWLTFRFQVSSSHPLCPSESGGRGAKLRRGYVSPFPAHPLIALFCYIPPPLRSSPYLRGTELRYDKRKTERGKRES